MADQRVVVSVRSADLDRVRAALSQPAAQTKLEAGIKSFGDLAAKTKAPLFSVAAAKAKSPSKTELDSFVKGLESVEKETKKHGADVLHSPRSANGSRVQAAIAAAAANGMLGTEATASGATRVKFATEDVAGAVAWGITWLKGHLLGGKPDFPKPPALQDLAFKRIALFSDWGTGMYGAPAIRGSILEDLPNLDLVVHLGDTYYAGLPEEMSERVVKSWPSPSLPPSGRALHRALNGNHEMYGQGIAYFGDLLPKLRQDQSVFAFSNGSWLIVGLDTAYKDHDLNHIQIQWLDALLAKAKADGLKVVAFSHHQLFDLTRSAGKKLRASVAGLKNQGQIRAWYWGHEHHAAIYEWSEEFKLYARCLGNGGMPEERSKFAKLDDKQELGNGYSWRRFKAGMAASCPGGRVLDGPNLAPDMPVARQQDFGPHGFVVLDFQGAKLFEEFWVVNWDGSSRRLVHRAEVT